MESANSKKFPKKQTSLSGPLEPKKQGGPPETRFKPSDPKINRQAQTINKSEKPSQPISQTTQLPKEKQSSTRFPVNNGVQNSSFPSPPPQFGQGNRNKPLNNGLNTSNAFQQQIQQYPKNNGGKSPSVITAKEAPSKDTTSEKFTNKKFILMVGGLPGKMDFKILKDNLQLQANKVHGKVKYVKNGQAFITFNNKSNADRAVELFNGKKVFGKSLNVSFTKNIPFEDQADGKPKTQSGKTSCITNRFKN